MRRVSLALLLLSMTAGPAQAVLVEVRFEAELFSVPLRLGNTLFDRDRFSGKLVYESDTTASLAGTPEPFTAFYDGAIVHTEMEFQRRDVSAQGTGGNVVVGDNQQVFGSNPGLRDVFEAVGLASSAPFTQFSATWEIERVRLLFDSNADLLLGSGGNALDALESLALPTDDSRLSLLPVQRVNLSLRRSDGGATTSLTGRITSFSVIIPEPHSAVLALLALGIAARVRWGDGRRGL